MNLVCLIGNAIVDPIFRGRFLADPLGTADAYHCQMTKGEVDLLRKVFNNDTKAVLEPLFDQLTVAVYRPLGTPCRKPPCAWSIYPPPEYRSDYIISAEEAAEAPAKPVMFATATERKR